MAGESVAFEVMFVNEHPLSVSDEVRIESESCVCDVRENAKIPCDVKLMFVNRLDSAEITALEVQAMRGEVGRVNVAIVTD